MAIETTSTSGKSSDAINSVDGDQCLHTIMDGIQHYLYNYGHSWIFLALGRSYFCKCSRSWVHVSMHLEKFLRDPKNNYSLLMLILEQEIEKFPEGAYYTRQLAALKKLMVTGPQFHLTQH